MKGKLQWNLENRKIEWKSFVCFPFSLFDNLRRKPAKFALTANYKCPLNDKNNVKKPTSNKKITSRRFANSRKEEVKFLTKVVKISIFALASSGVLFICAFARESKKSASDKEERIDIFIHLQREKFWNSGESCGFQGFSYQ